MKRPEKRIFQGFVVNAGDEDHLLFVADKNCDREVEFRRAYTDYFGASSEDVEIVGFYLLSHLYHNGVEKEYRILFVEK
jgi:galactose-1-phosphate uridylyltransferase